MNIPEKPLLQVIAEVRYWEDARINGVEDTEGTLIPFRSGDAWMPVIDLNEGRILDWPPVEADIHYKVCDAGQYLLLDQNRTPIARYRGDYVPDRLLCHGDEGYGDYIILKINADGTIQSYLKPTLDESEWGEIK